MIGLFSIELPIYQGKNINFSLNLMEVLNMMINFNSNYILLAGDMGLSGDVCSTTSLK